MVFNSRTSNADQVPIHTILFSAPARSAHTGRFPQLLSAYPYGDGQRTTFYKSTSPLFPEDNLSEYPDYNNCYQ